MRFSLLLFLAMPLAAAPATAQPVYAVILEDALVVDGSGEPPYTADIGLAGSRIAAIGNLEGRRAAMRIDASGLVAAPGFIDIHSHAPGSSLHERPDAENLTRQGVTTVFGGQDGSSPIPIGEALAQYDLQPAAVNVGLFVGHGSVRGRVMGESAGAPTPGQQEAMRDLVTQAMLDGAFGLSSGLEYTPGMFASTQELADLAAATAPFGGLYISHVRDEGGALMESVEEVIEIARSAGVAGQLTHHKIIGKHRWGGTTESLDRVVKAREQGIDITLDVYPYTASSTGMTILFPGWAKDGGMEALQARLADPDQRARIRQDVIAHINSERGGDPATIVAARCGFDDSLAGKSLADMAADQGLEASVENAADIAIELVAKGSCQGVFHSMSDEDVSRVLRSPHAMVASDGGVPAFGSGAPHPRSYGTFARMLARYVREQGVLTMEEAVRRMTRRPADRLGLHDRGRLQPGVAADVVLFDPDEVQDLATFTDPHQYATGVRYVFVNGEAVIWEGTPTGNRPGLTLRK